MSTNRNASLEVKIENNKLLLSAVKKYSAYGPTSDDIKGVNFEQYIRIVESKMTPYKESLGALSNVQKDNAILFTKLTSISKAVRSEIGEVKGANSPEYRQANSIVKLITGQNISEHSREKKRAKENLKAGEKEREFVSVSQLDMKSKLGNFSSLIGLVKNYSFYDPSDETLKIASLEAMGHSLKASLDNLVDKETSLTNERSAIIHLFDDKGGLSDRAKRAKMHVFRKYGKNSPEYKALTGKKY